MFTFKQIKIFKLVTGEEVLCEIVSSDNFNVSITKAIVFSMAFNPNSPNKGEVSFSPWLIGIDILGVVSLKLDKIIATSDPSDEVAEKYKNAFSIIT